jgi:hypothetical protein
LLPTALALLALGRAVVRLPTFLRRVAPITLAETIPILALLVIAGSLLGYGWFLIRFPNLGKGDTIKATYLLHIFSLLAILTADYLRQIRVPSSGLLIVWVMLMIHNSSAIVTHYVPW